ncbi:DUF4190 domain-containing protein [Brevibacterium paucivorans]|uniref:DUF4190 domain-containing protein n=1 Tax=Brevibacterium paucivorans TaxID=170994 RepID=A0A2N6VM87_9MICO|nr:DUF4190 domain-containing protein [Brevibacterium paucivorans]PMD05197.1 hypothetical protein CJ199_08930 [Brevibacterium paucivorans]
MSSNTPGSSGGSSRPYNDLPSYDSGLSSSGQGPASFKPGASHGSGGSAYGSATPGAASSGSPAYGSSSYGSSPSDYGSSQSSTYGGGDYSSGNYGAPANEPANPTPAYNPTPTYNAQPAPYGAPGYPVRRPTNGLAIAALVLGIISILSTYPIGIIGIAPVIMGHIALKQCKERDQEGKGLAIAGLITGYLAIAGFVVIVLFVILMIVLAGFSTY